MRVSLNGIVAADDDQEVYDWFGIGAFSPRRVRQALQENPEGEELVLEINSPGGNVWAGDEIYTVLRSAEGVQTRAEIQSLAASSASYLCQGCDTVYISPVAQLMLHLPSTQTSGDRVAHLRSLGMLDRVRESILNAYELRSGVLDRAALRRMMSSETWLTAQEALDYGLVDGILFQEETVSLDVVNAAGTGLRALGCGGIPDIAVLRDEYRRAKAAGRPAPEAIEHPADWRAQARLALEKMRF